MKIIGEKLNGTIDKVKKAVLDKDAAFIQDLARRQSEAGANWLDVNAGTSPEREADDLVWMVKTIQEAVETPLCLDSANNEPLRTAIKEVKRTPMINSISAEPSRLEYVLPLVAENKCDVIALAMDEKGIPKGVDDRISVIRKIIENTRKAGIPDSKIFIDPLVTAIATAQNSALVAFEVMKKVKAQYPEIHFSMGLSNISFGMPARAIINRTFLILALEAGLDTPIMDPLNRETMEAMYAAEMLLGRDRHCMNYSKAYRAGKIGVKKP